LSPQQLKQAKVDLEYIRDALLAKVLPQSQVRIPYKEWLRHHIPASWTADAKHLEKIAEHLDLLTKGDIDRLAIFMPPRHAKTETITVRYPVYMLSAHPEHNVLLTGYNERFARRLGRKSRNVAQGMLSLEPDKQASDEWQTTAGGVLMTRGVGSPPTGTGFHLIAIDDPIRRREDAESEVYREKCWDWYTDDLYTRLEPGGKILLVMTPWHEDDIGQRAIASEPGRWTVLKLPALAIEDDPLGRSVGQPLWPQRFDVEALHRIHDVMAQNEGLRSWEALYQCNPTPREGLFYKVGQIEIIDAIPSGMIDECRAWDLAATSGGGAFTVGVKIMGDREGNFLVTDMTEGQWGPEEAEQAVLQTAALDGRQCLVRLPQDPGQAGKAQAAHLIRKLAGYNVKSEPVTGDKETRAAPFAAQLNVGNVKFLRGDWNRRLIDRLRVFPVAGKDHSDAAADAFMEVTDMDSGFEEFNYLKPSRGRLEDEDY
jgi:predicted phage terminase large subunit-like protein